MGLTNVVWNFDTNDFILAYNPNALPPNDIPVRTRERAIRQSRETDGVLSLQHDLTANTIKYAQPVLEIVMGQSLKPMPVSECLKRSPYVNPGILLPPSLTNPPEIPRNQKAGPSNVQLGGIPIAEYVPRNSAMVKSLKVFVIMFFGQ
jgi:hypothetical protein